MFFAILMELINVWDALLDKFWVFPSTFEKVFKMFSFKLLTLDKSTFSLSNTKGKTFSSTSSIPENKCSFSTCGCLFS